MWGLPAWETGGTARCMDCHKDFHITGLGTHRTRVHGVFRIARTVVDRSGVCSVCGLFFHMQSGRACLFGASVVGGARGWTLKMRENAERHRNEGSPITPCVVKNDAHQGKGSCCDLRALCFSAPACVEEVVSVANEEDCVSCWLWLWGVGQAVTALETLAGKRHLRWCLLSIVWVLSACPLSLCEQVTCVLFSCACERAVTSVIPRVVSLGECESSICIGEACKCSVRV